MYVVMITGGIGSGKSLLAKELSELGAMRLDLDEVNRGLLKSDLSLQNELASRFGSQIIDADGGIDTKALATAAFKSRQDAQDLNSISFPYITDVMTRYIMDAECSKMTESKILAIEVPLLTEVPEYASLADEVIAVSAPSDLRLSRAVSRGMDAADVLSRMAMQATDAQREVLAHTVFENTGDIDDLSSWARAWYKMRMDEISNV